MPTQVHKNDSGEVMGVDLETFLNTPLRGLVALGLDCTRLWDDFR